MTPLPDCMAIGDSTATCAIHFSGRGNYISDNHIAATTEAFEQADAMGFCFSMQVTALLGADQLESLDVITVRKAKPTSLPSSYKIATIKKQNKSHSKHCEYRLSGFFKEEVTCHNNCI